MRLIRYTSTHFLSSVAATKTDGIEHKVKLAIPMKSPVNMIDGSTKLMLEARLLRLSQSSSDTDEEKIDVASFFESDYKDSK